MPQCKPEAKERRSARRSLSRGHGLGLLATPVLPPESWTLEIGQHGLGTQTAVIRAVTPV